MSGSYRARAQWVVTVVFALLALTACTGLPTDRAPRPGAAVLGQPRQLVQAQPDPPTPGATPQQIVRGFLRANVGLAEDHQVARSYLTEELGASWIPTDHVLVLDGASALEATGEGEVRASVSARGELGEDGRLQEFSTQSAPRSESFSLTQVQGQWRIDGFPDQFGLWLSASDFERQFRTASIFYGSPGEGVLVPDVRYFARDEGLPTALARAVLEPVPDYLGGAVVSAVAEETELLAGAVPVDPGTGVATVNLRGSGLGEDAAMTKLLWAQLVQTLTQAGGVRAVDLQVNGQPLVVSGVEGPVSSVTELGYREGDPAVEVAVLRARDELTLVDATNYALDDLPEDRAAEIDLPRPAETWGELTTDAVLGEFAGISRDQSTLWRWRAGEEVTRPEIGTALTPPAYDRTGALWVAGRSAAGPRVWVLSGREPLGAVARRVQTPWLDEGTTVQDLRVAPDSQRAVVLLRDDETDEQQIGVVGIVRDGDRSPVALTAPRVIAPTIESVETVAWASSTSLAVLGAEAQVEIATPYQVPLNGWVVALPAEDSSQHLRAVPDDEGFELVLVTSEGEIFTRSGGGWYSYRNGDDLVVPVG